MTSDVQTKQRESTAATAVPWANFRLPPFPETALRVLRLVNDDSASMRQLSDVISSDPALACEVLIIANSALLAQRHRVTSILQATVLLGTRTLKGVCLTVAVRAYLGRSMSYPSLRAVWRHSLACALIAEQLAGAAAMDKGTAYTGGVVHEIGRFALAVLRPKEYAALLDSHTGPASSILESERGLFGFDHREAGHHVITEWKLPSEFESMLDLQCSVRHLNDPWKMQDLIHVCCCLADTAGFKVFPGCEEIPYADLLEAIPVRERSLFHADSNRLAFDIGSKINAIELGTK
jgi:HD-like signal output (HDOD) protein